MPFRLQRLTPLFVAAFLLTAVLAAPVLARADTLAWSDPRFVGFVGPADVPNGEGDPIGAAGGFNAVSFADATHGWAVGVQSIPAGGARSSFVASTTTGGSTWKPAPIPGVKAELYGVAALSATDIWAVGANSTIAHFDGSDWTTKTISGTWTASKTLYAIAFVDNQNGWAVGDGYGVVRTTNGGLTWSVVVSPSGTKAYRGITALGTANAIAVGDSGKVTRLNGTGGVSALPSGPSVTLSGVAFSDPTHGVIVGDRMTFLVTSDGGVSWTGKVVPKPDSNPGTPAFTVDQIRVRAVSFADALNGIAVGTYQSVWRTTDAGTHWSIERLQDPGTDDGLDLRGIAFAGSADNPVTAGRVAYELLASRGDKARAYLGTWTGHTPPPPDAPTSLRATDGGAPGPRVDITWTDTSSDMDGFVIERAKGGGAYARVANVGSSERTWTDTVITGVDWTSAWHYRVAAFRGDLYSGWVTSGDITVDGIAPTTFAPDAAGSYIEAATIHLQAQDNEGGSGVAHTWYRLDGATPQDGTTVHVTGVRAHTLEFWSVDVGGTVETPHTTIGFTIVAPEIVDVTAPVTTSNARDLYGEAAHITLTAMDAAGGSGVAYTFYRLDGAQTASQGTSIIVGEDGQHTLTFWSVDAKGNVEETNTVTFTVDTVAPTTTSNAVAYYADSARVTLTAADTGSDVATTYCSIDGAQAAAVSVVTVKDSAAKPTRTIAFWSVDKAGNVEATKTKTFVVLATPSSKGTPSTPSSIATVKHGAAISTLGYMKKYSHTYSAKLYFYRKVSGHYVYSKSVTAKASSRLTFLKYSVTTSVNHSGDWRVRARRAVGSTVRYSSWEYFKAS